MGVMPLASVDAKQVVLCRGERQVPVDVGLSNADDER